MHIKSILLAVVLSVFVFEGVLYAQQLNTLTQDEKDQGWELLFDGQDLEGWHSYLKDQPGRAWKVEDGAITLDSENGKEGGDLTTDKEYQNFDLKLEWKISPTGNSGIIFNVHESQQFDAPYLTGPEMQILDNKEARDNKVKTHYAGSLYDMIAAPRDAAKPANEWNEVRLKEDEGHLTFWLNGKKVVDVQVGSERWKELVNESKFKDWDNFADYQKGRIALQDHGHAVWFRNIKIKEF